MVQDTKIFALGSREMRALAEDCLTDRQTDRECSPRPIADARDGLDRFVRSPREGGQSLPIDAIGPAPLCVGQFYPQQSERRHGKGRSGAAIARSDAAGLDKRAMTWPNDRVDRKFVTATRGDRAAARHCRAGCSSARTLLK